MLEGSKVVANDYTILNLNHAVLLRPVAIRLGAIGCFYRATASTAVLTDHTVIVTNAGAVPVKETPQDITAAIKRVVEGVKEDGI